MLKRSRVSIQGWIWKKISDLSVLLTTYKKLSIRLCNLIAEASISPGIFWWGWSQPFESSASGWALQGLKVGRIVAIACCTAISKNLLCGLPANGRANGWFVSPWMPGSMPELAVVLRRRWLVYQWRMLKASHEPLVRNSVFKPVSNHRSHKSIRWLFI